MATLSGYRLPRKDVPEYRTACRWGWERSYRNNASEGTVQVTSFSSFPLKCERSGKEVDARRHYKNRYICTSYLLLSLLSRGVLSHDFISVRTRDPPRKEVRKSGCSESKRGGRVCRTDGKTSVISSLFSAPHACRRPQFATICWRHASHNAPRWRRLSGKHTIGSQQRPRGRKGLSKPVRTRIGVGTTPSRSWLPASCVNVLVGVDLSAKTAFLLSLRQEKT